MRNPKVRAEVSSLHLYPGESVTIVFHETFDPLVGETVQCEARVTPEGILEFFYGDRVCCMDIDKNHYEIKTE